MARPIIHISDTIIFPPSCRERYLRASGPLAQPFREHGIAGGGVATFQPPYRIERTRPHQHVLLFTAAGEGRYETPHQAGLVRAGEVWLGPANVAYRYFCRRRWDVLWFHLDDTPRWAALRGDRVSVRRVEAIPRLGAAMEGCLAELLHQAGRSELVARAYAEIIATYLERELLPSEDERARRDRQRLTGLWNDVSADLRRRWNVAELARRVHLSPVHLHRIVLRQHGRTPMDVVASLRMRRAEEMLLSMECKLEQIAEALGYQTPFAFSRAFKRFCGESPAFFRRRAADKQRM